MIAKSSRHEVDGHCVLFFCSTSIKNGNARRWRAKRVRYDVSKVRCLDISKVRYLIHRKFDTWIQRNFRYLDVSKVRCLDISKVWYFDISELSIRYSTLVSVFSFDSIWSGLVVLAHGVAFRKYYSLRKYENPLGIHIDSRAIRFFRT